MDPLKDGTFPHRLGGLAQKWGHGRPAFLYKRKGVWWECSWGEYWEKSRSLAGALRGLGVKEGERVLVLGPNALERYFLEMACHFLGAVVLPLRDSRDVDELAWIIGENGVQWAIVRGGEELEQVAQVREKCPQLKGAVFWNYKGVARFPFPWAVGIAELLGKGGEAEVEGRGEAPCCILYSAGVTGRPRATAFSSQTLLQRAKAFVEREGIGSSDVLMPPMPPVRAIDEHFFAVHLLTGCAIALPEREETYLQDLKEVKPTLLYFTSRTWERLYKDIVGRLQGGGYLKGKLVGAYLRGRGKVWGEYLVGGPIRKKVGLERVRKAYDIGPLMAEEVYSFFSRLGVPLRKVYWSSEVGIISCSGPDGDPLAVGKVLKGIEARSEGGRIVVRADSGPEVQTGDLGRVEDDGIVLLGREGEVLSCGEEVLSLQVLESALRKEAFVADAFLFEGEGRLYGVIVPEGEALSRWARGKGIQYTGLSDLISRGEVIDLFRGIFKALGAMLPQGVRIGGFCLLPVPPEELAEFVALNGHWKRRALMEHLGTALAALRGGEVAGDFSIALFEED